MGYSKEQVAALVQRARAELGEEISLKQLIDWILGVDELASAKMIQQVGVELGLDKRELSADVIIQEADVSLADTEAVRDASRLIPSLGLEFLAQENARKREMEYLQEEYYRRQLELTKESSAEKPTGLNKRAGRKRLACNVWLNLMVNVKNHPVGSNTDDNELFRIWQNLHYFETRSDPDDSYEMSDPWDSFRKAIKNGENYTRRNPK